MSAPSPASAPPASSGPSAATFTASRTELKDALTKQMTFLNEMSSTLDELWECLPRCPLHGFNNLKRCDDPKCFCRKKLTLLAANLQCLKASWKCAQRKSEVQEYIRNMTSTRQVTSGSNGATETATREARATPEKSQEADAMKQGAKRKREEEATEAASKKPATVTTVAPATTASAVAAITPSRPPRSFIAALDTSTSEATALWNALPAARHAPALNYIAYAEDHRLRWPYFPASATHVSTWIASEAEDRSHIVKHGGNLSEVLTEMLDGLESWHVELGFGSVVTQRARAVVAGAAAWWG